MQVAHGRRTCSRRSSSSIASRASTRTRSATTASAFDTYARALAARRRERADARQPRATRDGGEPLAAGREASTTRSSTSSSRATMPSGSSSSASATRRCSRSSSRTSTAPSCATVASAKSRPENQSAIRALDRLYAQTERWAELAAILGREAEIGAVARRDARAQVPPRSGRSSSASSNLDAAIAAYRDVISAAPEHEATLEALEGLFAARHRSSSRSARSSSRSIARWASGRSSPAFTRRSSRTPDGSQEERLAAYYRHGGALRREASRPGADARGVHPRAQGVPARREVGRGGAASRRLDRRRLGDARERVRRHPRPAPDRTVQRTIGRRLAQTFEDDLGDVEKAEETYRYVLWVERARRRGARQPRSHLPLARVLGGSRAASSRCACSATEPTISSSSSSTPASARCTSRASGRRRTRCAPSGASSTASTRRTTAPSQALARIYERPGELGRAQRRLRARARERVGRRRPRPRSARRSRTSPRTA